MKYRINNALKGKLNIQRWIELYPQDISIEMVEKNNHIVYVNWKGLNDKTTRTENPCRDLRETFEMYNINDREVRI